MAPRPISDTTGDHWAAMQQRFAEAGSFLIREGDDIQREGKLSTRQSTPGSA